MGRQIIIKMLDDAEIEQINRVSLKILSEVGIAVYNEELRSILARHGAQVEGERVMLPGQLIGEALALAPKVVKFMDRRGKELLIGNGNRVWGTGPSTFPTTIDVNGVRRPTKPEDAIKLTRLMDALPRFDVVHTVEGPLEGVPEPLTNLKAIAIFFANTHKHALASPARLIDAQFWFDLAEITCPTGNLAKEPVLDVAVSTISPLQIDPMSAQLLVEAARRGVPIIGLPAPIAGATTPITLAGTLVLMNAEMLFLITAAQCVRETAPIIYGGVGAIMNMQTGHISMGTAALPILAIAHAQMGSTHNLPTYHPLNITDATRVDVQAGGELVLQQFCAMASPLNLIGAGGTVDNAMTQSPEALIVASDFLNVVERVFQGITVNEDTLAYEAIARVGPGGHFLTDEHTLRFLRSGEHLYDGCFERGGSWEAKDATLYRAHERVEAILAKHVPDVPDAHLEEIERYVAERSRDLVR